MTNPNIYTETADFWNSNICGSKNATVGIESNQFFGEFDTYFVKKYPYLNDFLDESKFLNKKVLIIGLGSGYELGKISQVTSSCIGLDLSPKTVELANKRKEYCHANFETICASATNMPFENEIFDEVVSIGCLHHIPDIQDAIKEIHRVSKEHANIHIMLYYKFSWRALVTVNLFRLFRKKYKSKPYKDAIAMMYDGEGSPHADLYSKADVKKIFKGFKNFSFSIENFDGDDLLPKVGRYIPRNFWLNTIGRSMGLDLYFTAKKEDK